MATGEAAPSRSLLTALPIVLGELLPEGVVDVLARRIEGHLTAWGPATEPVDSPEYRDDGYWRGPVWHVCNYLIVDGLRRAGMAGLADRIVADSLALIERSGFAEYYDPTDGAPLGGGHFSWTAAIVLEFAEPVR